MTLTFDQYDEICDHVMKISNSQRWYPTVKELQEYVIPNPQKYILFLIWLTETSEKPTLPADKEAMKLANPVC